MTRLMLWTFFSALILIIGGVFAQMMIKDSGVMMLTWNGWMVETTFWTGLGLILTVIITGIVLLALLRKLAPAKLLSRLRNRRDQKVAKKETAQAIDSWLHGADDRALESLQRVIKAGGSDRLPAAVSLAIGLQQSDWLERYGEFVQADSELKNFADAMQAYRLIQTGHQADLIDLMQKNFNLRQIPWLREPYWQALLESGQAADLIRQVNEAANIQPELRQTWLTRAVHAALQQASGQAGKASALLKPLSRQQKNQPDIIAAEIDWLCSVGEHAQAFKRLRVLLQRPDQIDHASLLMSIQIDNAQKLNFLESLEPSQPGPIYCRTLGVLNQRQQLWGNAQNWLEQGWKQGDLPSGIALAELFDARQMTAQANRMYRDIAHIRLSNLQDTSRG